MQDGENILYDTVMVDSYYVSYKISMTLQQEEHTQICQLEKNQEEGEFQEEMQTVMRGFSCIANV